MGYVRFAVNPGLNEVCFASEGKDVTATTSNTDTALNTITIPNITGHTMKDVYMDLLIGTVIDTSGSVNYLATGTMIRVQKSGGTWTDGIDLSGQLFRVAGNGYHPGTFYLKGAKSVFAEVDSWNTTYNTQWEQLQVAGNNLGIYDIITILRVITE